MRRGPSRHRLGLMVVCAGLVVLLTQDSAHGQGLRPRMPSVRPPFGGGMGSQDYKCGKCGNVMVANSGSLLDRPSSCPKCGVRFFNGGAGGTGKSADGNPNVPPTGGMPAMPPANFNPTPPPQAPFVPPQQPFTQPPPQAPVQPPMAPPMNPAPAIQPPLSGDASSTSTSTTVAAPSGRSKWLIPGIIALVVLGLLGVGGVWLMISSMKTDAAPARRSRNRPRRRSRDDDDDDDD